MVTDVANAAPARAPKAVGNVITLDASSEAILQNAGVLPQDLHGQNYIRLDLAKLRELEAGDTFDMTIPQTTEQFSAEVNAIEVHPNGDKSIFGRVVGVDGRFHSTVLTVGENAVYGQFTVPSGNYVFESLGEHGWIAAKRDLYQSHVEHEATADGHGGSSTDTFAPTINHFH